MAKVPKITKFVKAIEREIRRWSPASTGTYELIVDEGAILLRIINLQNPPNRIIYRLSATDINAGIREEDWNSIESKLRLLVSQGVLK